MGKNVDPSRRHLSEHCGFLSDDQLRRMAAAGVPVGMTWADKGVVRRRARNGAL